MGGETALMFAINNLQVVTALLACENVDIAAADNSGWTALHWACYEGHSDCVRLLGRERRMTQQIINTKNMIGNTPLMFAVENGHMACVEEMAKLDGVDWDTKNGDGESLKDIAMLNNPSALGEILTFLCKRKRDLIIDENAAQIQSQIKKMKLTTLAEKLQILETLELDIEAEKFTLENKDKNTEKELEEKYKKKEEYLAEEYMNKRENLKKELEVEKTAMQTSINKEKESLAKEHKSKISQKEMLEDEMKTRFSSRQPAPVPSPSSLVPECPVCLERMPPPVKIFTCPNGHFVCGNCEPNVTNCPTCRIKPVTGRATGMEQMLRAMFRTE